MNKKEKIKVWLKSISALAFATAIIGSVMWAVPAVAVEFIEVDTGPGNQKIWIAQGQSSSDQNPVQIQVQIGDILVFNQASTGRPHGLKIDDEAFVRRCHESVSNKPNAALVELPGCDDEDFSNVFRNFPVIQQDTPKKPFVVLRVVGRFNEIEFRCNVHSATGEMAGTLVMH